MSLIIHPQKPPSPDPLPSLPALPLPIPPPPPPLTPPTDDVLDLLLDQENLEVDPLSRHDHETPLHKAILYINSLPPPSWPSALPLAELLIDAGADPRVRNKARLKAVELVDVRNEGLRDCLRKAEYVLLVGDDVVGGDDRGREGGEGGSASDSE